MSHGGNTRGFFYFLKLTNMNDKIDLYLPFEKKNNEERTVEGYASTEALDCQQEIVKYTAIENALPDYMKFGNIREMHQASAVGKTIMAAVDKVKKGLWIKAKIVDDVAWKKVKEGVYNGFSIGGNIVSKIGNSIEELKLVEISVVDRPANPEALFSVIKFDDSGKEVKKDEMMTMDEPQGPNYSNIFTATRVLELATQLVDLYDWYSYSKKDTKNIIGALDSLKALAKQVLDENQYSKFDGVIEELKKKEQTTDTRNALKDSDFAYIDKEGNRKLPINDAAHVRNAMARFNQTQFDSPEAKKKVAKKILAAAKRLGIEVSADSAVSIEAKKFDYAEGLDLQLVDYFNTMQKVL